jgi:hypothetical protein
MRRSRLAKGEPTTRRHDGRERTRAAVRAAEPVNAKLLDLALACDDFDVQLGRLVVGDYSIGDRVVVQAKRLR